MKLYRRLLAWWLAFRAQAAREEAALHDDIGTINRMTAKGLRDKSEALSKRVRMLRLES